MLNIDHLSERIRLMISTYIYRFGLGYVGAYWIPQADRVSSWADYLSILTTTLNREGQRPVHMWIRSGEDCLLVLCVNGYFRNNMDDITDIVQRLWARRTTVGVPELVQIQRADPSVVGEVIAGVRGILERLPVIHQRPYRQRGFGCSLFAPIYEAVA